MRQSTKTNNNATRSAAIVSVLVIATVLPTTSAPFSRGGQEVEIGPFTFISNKPVHEELTADETLKYITAELSTTDETGAREVIRFRDDRVTIIAQKNADTDNDQSARLHFDDEELLGAFRDVAAARKEIVSLLKAPTPDVAKVVVLLGTALHTVQDFYSHSNWVELGDVDTTKYDILREMGDETAPVLLKESAQIGRVCDFDFDDIVAPLPQIYLLSPPSREVTTGYWRGLNATGGPILSEVPFGKCVHGGFFPSSIGLNKDIPLRPRHSEARQLAKLATWNYVSKIIRDLDGNDAALCALMGDTTTPGCQTRVTNLQAKAGDGQVTITWDPLAGASSYNVYFSTTMGVDPATAGGSRPNVSSPAVISGLSNGTAYYFVVTAVLGGVESLPSSEVASTPTSGPSNLRAEAGDRQVTLFWDPLPNATSYNVYLASEPGVTIDNYATLSEGRKEENVSSPAVITGLVNGTQYYFVVTAIVSGQESPPSAEAAARPVLPTASECDRVIETVAGNGTAPPYNYIPTAQTDGQLATSVPLGIQSVAVAPDKSIIFVEHTFRIRRVGPDGRLSTIVETVDWVFGAIDVSENGRIFVTAGQGPRRSILRAGDDGSIVVVAGGLSGAFYNGAPATSAVLPFDPATLSVYGDGSIGYTQGAFERAWITPTGENYNFGLSYLILNQATPSFPPYAVYDFLGSLPDPNDSTTLLSNVISRWDFPSYVRTPLVSGEPTFQGVYQNEERDYLNDSFRVAADGSLYFVDRGRVRRMTPSGAVINVAGNGSYGFGGDGGPAIQASFNFPFGRSGRSLDIGGDSTTIFIADRGNYRIRRAYCE